MKILLRNAESTVYAVYCKLPAGIFAVISGGNLVSVILDRRDIVAARICNCYADFSLGDGVVNKGSYRLVIINFVLRHREPFGKVSAFDGMDGSVRAMSGISENLNRNLHLTGCRLIQLYTKGKLVILICKMSKLNSFLVGKIDSAEFTFGRIYFFLRSVAVFYKDVFAVKGFIAALHGNAYRRVGFQRAFYGIVIRIYGGNSDYMFSLAEYGILRTLLPVISSVLAGIEQLYKLSVCNLSTGHLFGYLFGGHGVVISAVFCICVVINLICIENNLYCAYSVCCTAILRKIVVFNIVVQIHRLHKADYAAKGGVFACCGNGSAEVVSSYSAYAVAPVVFNAKLAAENAADFVFALNAAGCIAVFDSNAGTVRCRTRKVTAANDAADALSGGDNVAVECAVVYNALTHGLTLEADDTADIVASVDGCVADASGDSAVPCAAERAYHILSVERFNRCCPHIIHFRQRKVAPCAVVAYYNALFHGAVVNIDGFVAVAADKA